MSAHTSFASCNLGPEFWSTPVVGPVVFLLLLGAKVRIACLTPKDLCAPLQMRIDTSRGNWRNSPQLSALAHFADGRPIPYVQYSELELPPVIDMDDDPSSRSAMETMSHAFNSFSMVPSAFSTGDSLSRGCLSVQPKLSDGGQTF